MLKHWPGEKSNPLLAKAQGILSGKTAKALSAIYLKTKVWNDEGFRCKNAGEAKKIVQELRKMKKTLLPLKESTVLSMQNCAFRLEPIVDTLIETIPNRVR